MHAYGRSMRAVRRLHYVCIVVIGGRGGGTVG